MSFIPHFNLLKWRIILLVILILIAVYYLEIVTFYLLEYLASLIIYDENIDYSLSWIFMIFTHHFLIKKIISSLIFPCGYFIPKRVTYLEIFEDMLISIQHDLTFLQNNISIILPATIEPTHNQQLIKNKIKNLEKFATLVSLSKNEEINSKKDTKNNSNNECDNKFNKLSEELSNILNDITDFKLGGKDYITVYNSIQQLKQSLDGYKNTFNFFNSNKIFNFLKQRFNLFLKNKIETVEIQKNFNIYLLKPKKTKTETLMIFCNPNGMCAEFYSFNLDFINFYLDRNIALLLWNYKGYGERSESATFSNILSDAETVMKFVIEKYSSLFTKIGVHGLSIGGLPACHLAAKFPNHLSVLIADRTFASINTVVEHTYPFGSVLKYAFRIFFPSLFSNVDKYLNSDMTDKLILYDADDEIVTFKSSLKYQLTNEIFDKFVKKEISDYLDKKMLNKSEQISRIIFSYEELEKIKLKLFHIIRFFSYNNGNKLASKFYNLEIYFKNLIFKEHSKIDCALFSEQANEYINDFIINLFVWGFVKTDKIIFEETKVLNKNHAHVAVPLVIRQFYETFKEALSEEEFYEDQSHFSSYSKTEILKLIREFFDLFLCKINLIFVRVVLSNSSRYSDEDILNFNYNNDIKNFSLKNQFEEMTKKSGFIHQLSCGHNGDYSLEENHNIEMFLKNNKMC